MGILSRYTPVLILAIGIFTSPALAKTDPAAAQCSEAATPKQ
jgi:hypothetical protein